MNLLRAGLDKAMCLIQTLIDRTHAGIDRTSRFSHIGVHQATRMDPGLRRDDPLRLVASPVNP